MPSAERMMLEYQAQAHRARGWGNPGPPEERRCMALAFALLDVVQGNILEEGDGR